MWQTELIELVRALIFDLSDSPDYTDSELTRVIIAAALNVRASAQFVYNYTIDVSEQSITPDPSATATKDNSFLNLIALRAACFLGISKSRIQIAQAVAVRDDKNLYDFRDVAKHAIVMATKGYCEEYKAALNKYQIDYSGEYARAVLSPFRDAISGGYGRLTFIDA